MHLRGTDQHQERMKKLNLSVSIPAAPPACRPAQGPSPVTLASYNGSYSDNSDECDSDDGFIDHEGAYWLDHY
jgi:hypothetical protein